MASSNIRYIDALIGYISTVCNTWEQCALNTEMSVWNTKRFFFWISYQFLWYPFYSVVLSSYLFNFTLRINAYLTMFGVFFHFRNCLHFLRCLLSLVRMWRTILTVPMDMNIRNPQQNCARTVLFVRFVMNQNQYVRLVQLEIIQIANVRPRHQNAQPVSQIMKIFTSQYMSIYLQSFSTTVLN